MFKNNPNPLAAKITLIASLALLSLLLLVGCRPQKITLTERISVRDTISRTVTINYRDTVLIAPEAQSEQRLPLLDLVGILSEPMVQKVNQAVLSLSMKDGYLHALCRCDSLEMAVKLKDTQILELQKRSEVQMVVTEKELKRGIFTITNGILFGASMGLLGMFFLAFRKN